MSGSVTVTNNCLARRNKPESASNGGKPGLAKQMTENPNTFHIENEAWQRKIL